VGRNLFNKQEMILNYVTTRALEKTMVAEASRELSYIYWHCSKFFKLTGRTWPNASTRPQSVVSTLAEPVS